MARIWEQEDMNLDYYIEVTVKGKWVLGFILQFTKALERDAENGFRWQPTTKALSDTGEEVDVTRGFAATIYREAIPWDEYHELGDELIHKEAGTRIYQTRWKATSVIESEVEKNIPKKINE